MMLKDKKLFLLDMDGTLYLGDRLFDGTVDFLKKITKEWFPQTNYRLDNTYSVMISYQTSVNQDNDDDLGVYWVPIVEE